jgi:ribosomal RNA assembly protein
VVSFLSDKTKSAKRWQEKLEKQAGKSEENKRKREAAFVPPEVRIFSLFK